MEDKEHVREHEEHLRWNHRQRQELIQNASDAIKEYNKLLNISAVVPWMEWEVFIQFLQSRLHICFIEKIHDDEISKKNAENPFLIQMDNIADQHLKDSMKKNRFTTADI